MSSTKKQTPFQVEKQRVIYARANKLELLESTYNGKLPEITNHNSKEMWDKINGLKENLLKSKDSMARHKLKIVTKELKGIDLKILNIGFGSGNLERVFIKSKKNVLYWEGIDISAKSVKRVKKIFPQFNFKIGSIYKLKNRANEFDYVIILEVLEHISPKKILQSLKEVARVTKVNGKIIISVPLNEDLECMMKEKRNYNEHVRMYTSELLSGELKISGLQVMKIKKLYAFNSFYSVKTVICNYILKGFRQPNNLIIIAKKIR